MELAGPIRLGCLGEHDESLGPIWSLGFLGMLWDLRVWAPSTKQGKTAQWQDLCSKGSVQGLRASFRFPSLSGNYNYWSQ